MCSTSGLGRRSHDFDREDSGDGISTLKLTKPGPVQVRCDVAALLEAEQTEETRRIRNTRLDAKPYWSIERCRIGDSRTVPVELIVNGQAVARQDIEADGSTESLTFDVEIPRSSWLAVRILPSVHTNPIWVSVDGKPVRASRASAEWCQQAVEVCWNSKQRNIREGERAIARAAYDEALKFYAAALREASE